MRLLKLLSVSTIVLLTLNIFNVISISYLWFLIPLFILPIVFLFSKFLNFKNIFKQLDTDLTKIGIEISEKLNSMGYNIKTTQGIIKNDKKIISFNHYFDNSGWGSGIQLTFQLNEDKLKFNGYGAFGFRNKSYDTEENKKVLEQLINDVEQINV
jgi:hypothetical protein